jgi:hypothetical protein
MSKCGSDRIHTIIERSRQRNDNKHLGLEEKLKRNAELTLSAHRNCVSTYTSKHHIKRLASSTSTERQANSAPLKRIRRSEAASFNFTLHCIFCGENCQVEPDRVGGRQVYARQAPTEPVETSRRPSLEYANFETMTGVEKSC